MSRPIRIHCVHTAAVHEPTFTRLFGAVAPEASLVHSVRPDWLARARKFGLSAELSHEVEQALGSATRTADAVLLSCSTLGPIVDAASNPRIIRIDAPLMRRAAAYEGPALLAICLESTCAATIALFDAACAEVGNPASFRVALCRDAWAWFDRGDSGRFAEAIVQTVNRSLVEDGPVGCIVLAQASMAVAEPLLVDHGIPVLTSPRLAVAETLRVARKREDVRP